jgi:hypothetical protein
MNDDVYSLSKWLEDEILALHNKTYLMYPNCERACLEATKGAYERVLKRIINNPNQRPHLP